MGAIGEYVHYYYSNYYYHGINRSKNKTMSAPSNNISFLRNYERNRMAKIIGSAAMTPRDPNLQIAEYAYSYIYSTGPDTNIHFSGRDQIQKEIEKEMFKDLSKIGAQINWDLGTIEIKDRNSNVVKNISKIKTKNVKSQHHLDTILKRVRELIIRRDSLAKNTLAGSLTKTQLTNDINIILNALQEIFEVSRKDMQLLLDQGEGAKKIINNFQFVIVSKYNRFISKKQTFLNSQTGNKENLISFINEVIDAVNINKTLYQLKGILHEKVTAALQVVTKTITVQNLNKVIKETIKKNIKATDKGKTQVMLASSLLPALEKNKAWSRSYEKINSKYNTSEISVVAQKSGGYVKIDSEMNWYDTNLKVSAKSYSFKNNSRQINAVGGAPWITLVGGGTDADFVNHYLNTVAIRGGYLTKEGFSRPQKEPPEEQVVLAHEAMKKLVAYTAITGDVFGREGAKIISIHDNTSGKTRLYTISELFMKLLATPENLIVLAGSNQKSAIPIEQVKLFNTWAHSSDERIASLVLQMHNYKIYAKFRFNKVAFDFY